MDNSLMVGLSTQQMLRKRMDVTANNLANMSTTGFKVEHFVNRPLSERPAHATDNPTEITFAEAWQLQRDMSTGPISRTGNPLDIAIEGDGYFAVQSPNGETYYTRDGEFSLDADGTLVTRNGHFVLDAAGDVDGDGEGETLLAGGGRIQINPEGGEITITSQGNVMQDGAEIARIDLSTFEVPAALEKLGNNLYAAGDQAPIASTAQIAQGFLEGSNVSPIVEMTQMIEISRSYQSVAKLISESNQLREQAISKLAKVR